MPSTVWFDVAIVTTIFAIGNICFGHFEEHMPKIRRVLKVVIVTSLIGLLSYFGLRWIAYSLIGAMGIVAVYVHAFWLPKHGINGWTGEPKDKYRELVAARPRGPASRPRA